MGKMENKMGKIRKKIKMKIKKIKTKNYLIIIVRIRISIKERNTEKLRGLNSVFLLGIWILKLLNRKLKIFSTRNWELERLAKLD